MGGKTCLKAASSGDCAAAVCSEEKLVKASCAAAVCLVDNFSKAASMALL